MQTPTLKYKMKRNKMRKAITAALFTAISTVSFAQSGTNSPYSQYGLGMLSDQSSGFNRGMNGLAYGLREHNQVNYKNPASYSAVDSLSFIFDAGVGLQLTNFEEGGKKVNAKTANFEYAVALFRAVKHVGISFGIIPYSNVGYTYSNSSNVNEFPSTDSQNATYTNTYHGEGGIHQVYLGTAWEPLKGFSIGANISYLWGDYTRYVINSYSNSYVNTLSKYYTAEITSYKIDFGMQYTNRITKKDILTFGATYSIGHKLGAAPECKIISNNSQTGVADTTLYSIKDGLSIPDVIGAGVAWNHNQQLKIGIDYQIQKWKDLEYPQYGNNSYQLAKGLFKDRHKLTFGGEYCQGELSRNFLGRVHYRAGISYATPYLMINDKEGPKELSISAGLGIPIMNGYNSRSILNISAQWVNMNANGLIKENTFRINIGFTFNEKWFSKFKVE